MSTASAATDVGSLPVLVTLRGTKQGLEAHIEVASPAAPLDQVLDQLRTSLAKAPGFFRGEDIVVRFVGAPLPGSLGAIETVVAEFGLRLVGVRSDAEEKQRTARAALAAVTELDESEAQRLPPAEIVEDVLEPAADAEPSGAIAAEPIYYEEVTTRMIVGPIRSGVVLEATGDVTIIGDVNAGAEIRAGGSIVVLGALRGVAHAAMLGPGFILALRLDPQQLRLGNRVARAADSDEPGERPEIAYMISERIVVEAYQGRLPGRLKI